MADKATITQESFYKSLSKLEALAGGGQEDLDKSQICTGPNSEKKEWAGSRWKDVPGDGPGADMIRPDGTDYNERGVRKSIQEKVAKGIPLSSIELSLLKSDMEKADKDDDKDEKGEKEVEFKFGKGQGDDDDKEKYAREMGKSFDGAVQGSETLQKGIEVSQFLAELSKAFAAGLEGIETRVNANMEQMGQQLYSVLSGFAGEQGEFNKSLADALVNIGHGVAGSIQQVEQVSQQPAGPPRSQGLQMVPGGQQGAPQGFVQKSFAGQQPGENLSKAVVADALTDMLEKGESGISPIEIIKFDTTGELRPDLQQRVAARVQGAGR